MKNYQKDLTSTPLFKGILFYSLPLVLTNLIQVLFNLADIAVVGHFAGTIALGAVGSTSQLIFMFTGLLMGLGGGINVIVAFYLGAKSDKDTDESVHTAFTISLLVGIFLALAGFLISKPVLILIKTKEILLPDAVIYFRIFILGMPGVAIFNFGNAVLGAAGDTKRPLYFLSAAGLINIGLNLLFVIVFNLSCMGVALASIISHYISAILVMLALRKGLGSIKFSFRHISLNSEKAKRILKIGIPAGLQNVIFAVANTFIQVGVNSFDAIMVAGVSACSNLDNIVYSVMGGFYTACATFIGQNYGAGKKKRILQSTFISNGLAFLFGSICGISFFLFGRQWLSLFTNDPAVIEAGLLRLNIMWFSFPFASLMDNTLAANRGLGKTIVPSAIILAGSCLFRILWIYTVFACFGTISSLFLLYIFSWLITAAAEFFYFWKTYSKI